MTLKFVTAETSTLSKKPSFKFPLLKQDEKTVITFLTQIKDFDTSAPNGNETPWLEREWYYDETSKTTFRFASDVSPKIRDRISGKTSVKKQAKTLALCLQYTTEPNSHKITGVGNVYVLLLPQTKSKELKEIWEANREEGIAENLFDVDFKITCEKEKFQDWKVSSTKQKAFNNLDASVKADLTKRAKDIFETKLDFIIGKELDEDTLIEKFALDSDSYTTSSKVNPMSGNTDDDDFSHLTSGKKFGE